MNKLLTTDSQREMKSIIEKSINDFDASSIIPMSEKINLRITIQERLLKWIESKNTPSFSEAIQQEETYEGDHRLHGEHKGTKKELKKLGHKMMLIFKLMADGRWRTPEDIKHELCLDISVTTITRVLRSFREHTYGSHKVNKKASGKGMQRKYCLEVNGETEHFKRFMRREMKRIDNFETRAVLNNHVVKGSDEDINLRKNVQSIVTRRNLEKHSKSEIPQATLFDN